MGWKWGTGRLPGSLGNRFIGSDCGEAERQRIKKALLDYCGQDTLAMLRLVENLQHVSA